MPPLLSNVKEQSNACTTDSGQIVLRRASYVKVQDLASPHHIDLNLLPHVIQRAQEAAIEESQKGKQSIQGENDHEDISPNDKVSQTKGMRRPRQDSDASSVTVSVSGFNNKQQRQSTSSEGYNLCVLVGKVDVVVDKLRVDRSRVRLAEVEVGDETGSMSLRARDDQIDILQKISHDGGAVVLRNCTVELYQGRHLRLAITKWGKLCCFPDNVQSTPDPPKEINREVNLSLVDLNLMAETINQTRSTIAPTNQHMSMHAMGVDNRWFEGMHTGRDMKHQNQYNVKKYHHGRRNNRKYSDNDNLIMQAYPNPYYTGDENMMMHENSYSNFYSGHRGYVLPGNPQHIPNNQNRQHAQRRQGRRGSNNKRQTDVLLQQQQLRQMQMQQIYFQEQHQQRMYYQHQQQMQQSQTLVIPNLMQAMSLDSGASASSMNVENQYQTNPTGLNLNAASGFQRMDANSSQHQNSQSSHQQSHATMQLKYSNPTVQEAHINPYDGTLQLGEPTSPHNHARNTLSQQQNHSNLIMQRSQEWHEIGSNVSESNSKTSNQHQNALMQPPPHQVQQNQYGYYAYPPPASQIYGSSPIYGQNMMYMVAPPNAGGSTSNVPPNIVFPEVKSKSKDEGAVQTSTTATVPTTMKMSYAEKAAQKDDNVVNLAKSPTPASSNVD